MCCFSLIISHAKLLHWSPGWKFKVWERISHDTFKACCKIFLQHFLHLHLHLLRQNRQEETHCAAKSKLWCYGLPPKKQHRCSVILCLQNTHTHPADLCTMSSSCKLLNGGVDIFWHSCKPALYCSFWTQAHSPRDEVEASLLKQSLPRTHII